MVTLEGVILTKILIIENKSGNVFHGLKKSENSFNGFGEAYFSFANYNSPKGWKRHNLMTLNLIVPIGEIKFVLFDDRKSSKTYNEFFEIELSYNNYCRLTIPPGIWVSFVGIGKGQNILLNIGNLEHDPNEADTLLINNNIIPYTWI